jgi:hypothetical protein
MSGKHKGKPLYNTAARRAPPEAQNCFIEIRWNSE